MAFLRIEKKKSGHYMRIVESYRENGKPKHKTLYSLGKVEDYPANQLEAIAKKLLQLAGVPLEEIIPEGFEEIARLNYGYAMVIKKLWKTFELSSWSRKINNKSKVQFDWVSALQIMIAERLNEPCSKRQNFFHQEEYIGFTTTKIDLHQFYRCLDLLSTHSESLQEHLFTQQQRLSGTALDVVFYDVTTLYFDSQLEKEDSLRQKGFSKDGKAHKTQIVLGLLVDKFRNPISYQIYKGNTSEGLTMKDALAKLRKNYKIDKITIVADSAMIGKENRDIIENQENATYIIGDRLKNLPKAISKYLINPEHHQSLHQTDSKTSSNNSPSNSLTYTSIEYSNRTIYCTYSTKRARKDAHQRQKLIDKAKALLQKPSQLKQSKKRGAGRFIKNTDEEHYELDEQKIQEDSKWDGYKAIATNSLLPINEVLSKYSDLFEVEHSFRTLKSQLEIRPMFHWTDQRIEGHLAMCFIAYTFLNYMRINTELQQLAIVKTLDKMQLSQVMDKKNDQEIFMRSKITENQKTLTSKLKLQTLKDITSKSAFQRYFG